MQSTVKLAAQCAVLFTALFTVSACDPMSGISSAGTVPRMGDIDCVSKVVEGTPGVTSVEHQSYTRDEIKGRWRDETIISYDKWTYFFGSEVATLSFEVRPDGTRYQNAYIRGGWRMPVEKRAAFRPIMHTVNQRLETECSIPTSDNLTVFEQ